VVREGIEVPDGESWAEVEAVLPAGGVSFHNLLTIHGSEPNRSDTPRRSLAIHIRTENSRPADAPNPVPLIQLLDNMDYNPLIYGS
jgi:ectoine hydroxylase-related dioxygenase (phytanoyl-CoA dioxygenase family)